MAFERSISFDFFFLNDKSNNKFTYEKIRKLNYRLTFFSTSKFSNSQLLLFVSDMVT